MLRPDRARQANPQPASKRAALWPQPAARETYRSRRKMGPWPQPAARETYRSRRKMVPRQQQAAREEKHGQ